MYKLFFNVFIAQPSVNNLQDFARLRAQART